MKNKALCDRDKSPTVQLLADIRCLGRMPVRLAAPLQSSPLKYRILTTTERGELHLAKRYEALKSREGYAEKDKEEIEQFRKAYAEYLVLGGHGIR